MAKWVYKFEEGSAAMRNLLGGKGCNLAEMTNLGMPIPQGFTVTTEACTDYYNSGKQITKEIQDQIFEALAWLEGVNGKKFGDTEDPLLVSVRSGARASMPGMMDTILNLGLNDVAVEGFAKKTGNPRFAYDSYRRFIQMYSDVVMEVPKSYFEKIIDEMKEAKGVHYDTELDANDLKELAEKFKAVYKEAMNGEEFPQDPKEQLMGAVKAVEIGDGFLASLANGSTNNDAFTLESGHLTKKTNHSGGVLGGISDGSELIVRAAVKPTPSIARTQSTVNLDNEEIEISIKGRHDPIIVPRAVVVVESMTALTLADLLLCNMCSRLDSIKNFYQEEKDV